MVGGLPGRQGLRRNLRFLLYKMKLADLDRLIWALEGKRGPLSKEGTALRGQLDALGNPSRVMQSLYWRLCQALRADCHAWTGRRCLGCRKDGEPPQSGCRRRR